MMKKLFLLLVVGMMLLTSLSVIAPTAVEREILAAADPGILPDSPFYFIDTFFEQAGDDPEKALEYKEEKIAELEAMAKKNNAEAAEKALEKAQEYSDILEKEVTPEMEERVKESTEIAEEVLEEVSEELPQLADQITKQLAQEERIALAAEVSTQIKKLCETLAKLDPKQYAETCKIDGDSPQWLQKYDKELTEEQKKHAQTFAEKLTECAESEGLKCDCEGMGVKKFEELCVTQRDLKRQCDAGEEGACKAMMEQGPMDMFEYLPDYLHPVVANLMKKYSKANEQQYEQIQVPPSTFPNLCQEAGITSPLECAKFMKGKYKEFSSEGTFEFNEGMFMEECVKYESEDFCKEKAEMMKEGEFTPEHVEFGPGPCKDKGLTTVEECRKYMEENFQRTSEGAYIIPAGPPARIAEFGRDCHAVQELAEKVRCFEEFYNKAQGRFTQPLPPTATPTPALPSGMEDWQKSYYERWLKATTEEEKAKIKAELSEEMNRRNEQDKKEYKHEGNYQPTPSVPANPPSREEPPEIEVEVRGNVAEVEVSRDGYRKDTFMVSYTSRDQLVSDIAVRLSLTKEEVEQNLKLEFEEEENEVEDDAGEEDESEEVEEPTGEIDEGDRREEANSGSGEDNNSGEGMMVSESVV